MVRNVPSNSMYSTLNKIFIGFAWQIVSLCSYRSFTASLQSWQTWLVSLCNSKLIGLVDFTRLNMKTITHKCEIEGTPKNETKQLLVRYLVNRFLSVSRKSTLSEHYDLNYIINWPYGIKNGKNFNVWK